MWWSVWWRCEGWKWREWNGRWRGRERKGRGWSEREWKWWEWNERGSGRWWRRDARRPRATKMMSLVSLCPCLCPC